MIDVRLLSFVGNSYLEATHGLIHLACWQVLVDDRLRKEGWTTVSLCKYHEAVVNEMALRGQVDHASWPQENEDFNAAHGRDLAACVSAEVMPHSDRQFLADAIAGMRRGWFARGRVEPRPENILAHVDNASEGKIAGMALVLMEEYDRSCNSGS